MATHGMYGHSKWHMFYPPQSLVCHNSRHLFSEASRYLQIWMKLHIASYSSSCSHHFSLSCLSFKPFKPALSLRPPRNWTASAPNFSRRISCRSSSKLFSKDALNKALPFLSAKQWHWNISYMKVLLLRWWIIRRVVYYSKNLQNMYSSILWNISPLFLKNR